MRILVSLLAAVCAFSAFAVNVEIGFSGYSHNMARHYDKGNLLSPSSPWMSGTQVICGVNGGSHFDEYNVLSGVGIDAPYVYYDENFEDYTSTADSMSIAWNDKNDPMRVQYGTGSNGGTPVFTTVAEVVNLPIYGWVLEPYLDRQVEHGVLTFRGDPCSIVVNDTSKDRMVNGVLIKSGDGARLVFPFHLKMDEVPGIRFFDLVTGEEFYARDYASYGQSGVYYSGGAYSPMWTGHFRFTDGTSSVHTITNIDQIVFADINGGSTEDKVLFATNNMPVYAGTVSMSTNIQLMTWWDFSHSDWGSSPKAKINDEVVCDGHSTSHIISYTVNENNLIISELSGKGYVYFTMSQEPQSGYSGGSCTMRCWDASAGSGTAGYSAATADHKAESSAGTGVARFRMTVDIKAGTWKVEAL